jgi:hypothetical protein
MKYIISLSLMLVAASSIFAFEGVFLGVGAEGNAHTRTGGALGSGITLGFGLSPRTVLGVKALFHTNFDTVIGLEPVMFFRFYPAVPGRAIFVQAEAGSIIYYEYDKPYPAFIGALAVGWQFEFNRFYIEPSVRLGWPFAFGAGLAFGIKFPKT